MDSRFRSAAQAVRASLLASLVVLAAACGGSGSSDCGVDAQKDFVLEVVNDWYLFQELLPGPVNPDAFINATDLLDYLTQEARTQGKDRGFSFLTTRAAEQAFFDQGQSVAFGLGTQLRDERLFISKVEPGSPADDAGFRRGDEILAIGPSPQDLTPVSSFDGNSQEISAAFGPAQEGVTRSFSVRTVEGDTVQRTMTKRRITLDPVPRTVLLPRQGLAPVGYLAFDSFISPAEDQLRQAFAQFRAQNVRDVIVDLRYNGGGLLSVGHLLGNLLAEDEAGDVMFRVQFNADHQDQNETIVFEPQAESIPAMRIAFITTDGSASASELVISSLEPYAQVAIVGSPTFGKPVGQSGFEMRGCETILRLVAFRSVNAEGDGNYFEGLPDSQFQGAFCAADDELADERGTLGEDSTATALQWIDTGICPAAKTFATQARYPRPAQPTTLQDNRPGLF